MKSNVQRAYDDAVGAYAESPFRLVRAQSPSIARCSIESAT